MNLKWKLAQYFELWWWRRYLGRQEVETYLSNKKQYWRKILLECPFELKEGQKVLDAGCGPAGIFIVLDQQRVDALDPLIDDYDGQLSHFSKKNHPNVHFIRQSLEEFVSEPAYDLVFCLNAINHVRDLQLATKRFAEATKKDGRLALSVDTHKWKALKWLFRLIPADVLHPHQQNLKDYIQLLQDHEFDIIKTQKLKTGLIFDYHIIFANK